MRSTFDTRVKTAPYHKGKQTQNSPIYNTTETGRVFFSEKRETVTVSDKQERFGSRGLKLSSEKSNAREHIPSCGLWFSSPSLFFHALLLMISRRSFALIVTE